MSIESHNSAKLFLQLRVDADARVDLDAAGQVHIAVDLLLSGPILSNLRKNAFV